MASTSIEFKVGIVVLIGLAILAGSLYWLQGYKLERNAQVIWVQFDDVGTLAIGDRITVSGVRKGKVNDLKLTDSGVLVQLLLSKDVTLKRDARFVIKNMGLMGERFIAITPGKDTAKLDLSQCAVGQYDTGLPDVMGLMGEMVSELRDLVFAFRKHIGTDSTLTKLNTTITNLEQVSIQLNKYLTRHEGRIDQTVRNFVSSSKKMNQILSNSAPRIDSTLERFDRVSQRLDLLTYQLDTLSMSAREFADKLNSPDGSLQLMLEDRRFYDDLRRTADNLDDLINDIRENPRKYINLTLEIF